MPASRSVDWAAETVSGAGDMNHLAASGSDHTDVWRACRGQLEASDLGEGSADGVDFHGAILRHGFRDLRERKTAGGDGAALIEALQLLGGITGLDAGGGTGTGSDGDRRGRAQNAVHGNLQRHGAAGRNVARQGEIDLIFPGVTGAAGEGHRDGDATHDGGDGFGGAEVVEDASRIIPRRIGAEPGSPGDQGLSRLGGRTRDSVVNCRWSGDSHRSPTAKCSSAPRPDRCRSDPA